MERDDRPGSYDPTAWLVIVGVLLVGAYFLWGYFWATNEQLIKNLALGGAYHLRYVQLPFSFLMTDGYKSVIYNLPNLYQEHYGTLYDDGFVQHFIAIALRSVAIVFAAAAIPRGIYLIANHHKLNFSRTLSLWELIQIQRERYKRIKPTTSRNLLQEDSRFGSLASAMNPIDLVAHRAMVHLENQDNCETAEKKEILLEQLGDLSIAGLRAPEEYTAVCQPLSHIEYAGLTFPTGYANPKTKDMTLLLDHIGQFVGTLSINPSEIREYYRSTLGPRCKCVGTLISISPLPPFERCLWVLFMACVAQKEYLRERIEKLLDQFADTFVEGPFGSNEHQMDMTGIDELFELASKEIKVQQTLARIARSHGYYYTAFTALYTAAKKNYGTITSQDFRWLRITNRILFYTLNQVGMERARYEAAAIRCHYLAEKKRRNGRGERIGKPQVESAVLNLVYSLDSEGWTAIPRTEQDIDPESKTFMKARWVVNKTTGEVASSGVEPEKTPA